MLAQQFEQQRLLAREMGVKRALSVARVTGVPAPHASIPAFALKVIAFVSETLGRLSGRSVLISRATVRLMRREAERTRFDPTKPRRELGLAFRSVEDTIRDEVDWFRTNGWLATKN